MWQGEFFTSNLFLLNETCDGFKHKVIFCIVYRKNWNKKKSIFPASATKIQKYLSVGNLSKKNNLLTDRPTSFFNGRVTANKISKGQPNGRNFRELILL